MVFLLKLLAVAKIAGKGFRYISWATGPMSESGPEVDALGR
jgi:hypothetical protein